MRHRSGFTAVEAVVAAAVIALVAMTVFILMPRHVSTLGGRTVCSSRIAGIYKALTTYAAGYQDQYPLYTSTPTHRARGFRYTQRLDSTYTPVVAAEIADSVTAPLWAIVRDGSTGRKTFLCPFDTNVREDTLLDPTGTPVTYYRATWDFNLIGPSRAPSLSYSVTDMYDDTTRVSWNNNSGSDWVFLADDNNNDSPAGHVRYKGLATNTPSLINAEENNTHHKTEGQNVLYGDGHAGFANDPFQGPANDNIYAHEIHPNSPTRAGSSPTLSHHDAADTKDVVLLPITGNRGVNLVNSK